jgi:hypothetical protein
MPERQLPCSLQKVLVASATTSACGTAAATQFLLQHLLYLVGCCFQGCCVVVLLLTSLSLGHG